MMMMIIVNIITNESCAHILQLFQAQCIWATSNLSYDISNYLSR